MGRSKNIWRDYYTYCDLSFGERSGTTIIGMLPSLARFKEDLYYKKPETIAEHSGRTAFLTGSILMNYPEIADQKEWFSMMMFSLCHDIGETELGDMPDDRKSDEAREEIRKIQADVTDEFFCRFPAPWHAEMIKMHPEFESYTGKEALFCKLVDKADAVLFQLFLYTKGIVGDVRRKDPKPSGRDLRFARIIGSYRALDVWCLHFRVVAKNAPELYLRPVYKVMATAFKEVYGELPLCMTINVTDIPLDAPEDNM